MAVKAGTRTKPAGGPSGESLILAGGVTLIVALAAFMWLVTDRQQRKLSTELGDLRALVTSEQEQQSRRNAAGLDDVREQLGVAQQQLRDLATQVAKYGSSGDTNASGITTRIDAVRQSLDKVNRELFDIAVAAQLRHDALARGLDQQRGQLDRVSAAVASSGIDAAAVRSQQAQMDALRTQVDSLRGRVDQLAATPQPNAAAAVTAVATPTAAGGTPTAGAAAPPVGNPAAVPAATPVLGPGVP